LGWYNVGGFSITLERFLVEKQLRQSIQQFALFLAEVFAPNDSEAVALLNKIARAQRPHHRLPLLPAGERIAHFLNLEDFAAEPAADAGQVLRIERERAAQFQQTRHGFSNWGGVDLESRCDFRRHLDRVAPFADKRNSRLGL